MEMILYKQTCSSIIRLSSTLLGQKAKSAKGIQALVNLVNWGIGAFYLENLYNLSGMEHSMETQCNRRKPLRMQPW